MTSIWSRPPAGIDAAFTAEHDEDKLGPLRAKEPAAVELASLADVVRFLMLKDRLPLREAASTMLDTLDQQATRCRLFCTQPGTWASLVPDDHCWWRPVAAKPSEVRRPKVGFVTGRRLIKITPERPAVLGLYGVSGALQLLRQAWAAQAMSRLALEAEPLVRLAMPSDLAGELFGFGDQAGAAAPGPALTLVQRGDQVGEKAAIAATSPPAGFSVGGGWSPEYRAELLAQYERLRTVCQSSEVALIHLHRGWGYSKAEDKSGGPLAKVLSKARAEAPSRKRVHRTG